MQIRECSVSARQGAQKLESEISQENVFPPNKSAIEVTGSSSQQEADTAALRKKAPRSKKTKYPPIDKTASTAGPRPKLPFEFVDQEFSDAATLQMVDACTANGPIGEAALNSMLSVLLAQKPRDPFELMIINHLTALNALVMKYTGLLLRAKNGAEIELFERVLNRTERTFVAGLETWHRCYRSSGEPKFLVQQTVSVSDGSQAIVANVAHGGSGGSKVISTPAVIADQRTEPMQIIEPSEQLVPVISQRKVPL